VLCNDRSAGSVTTDEVFGGKLIYQPDPVKAAQELLDRIDQKRAELGLPVPQREVIHYAG
jgi:carbon-monoxide dehydrogenase catalytic subunit